MPVNSNPDKRGEGVRVFYQSGEYDTSQTDTAILGDSNWIQICQVEVNETNSRDLEATEDACSGDEIGYTAGRMDRGITLTLNEFRLLKTSVRAFETLVNSTGIIAVLVLDADIDDPDAVGGVMNALVGQNDKTSPQKGLKTRSLEFKPAARATHGYKRVYGSGVAS